MESKAPETVEKRSFLKRTLSVLQWIVVNFLIFAVLAEVISLVYINVTNWPGSKPSYRLAYNSFWVDSNPVFGVWHRPSGTFIHKSGCYTVQYTTNSYGARDVERSLHSSQPRTIVLGDSFMEGMGLPDQARLSNILESDTGHEHLNFGTGGNFGPLQYALLYKSMAAAYDHTLVVVGVLPDNDFHDMSLSYWKSHGWDGRYRPYYGDNFSIVYDGHFDPNAGEGAWNHTEAFFRAYLASYHVGEYIHSRLYARGVGNYSGYNDYDDLDLARLKNALEDIKATADAHGAQEAVFLIPRAIDFERLRTAGSNRLGPTMEQWGNQVGIPVKDLLPQMNAATHDFQSYFLSCDGHWAAPGAARAAQILEPWLYGGAAVK
jgi:hypothetical protein